MPYHVISPTPITLLKKVGELRAQNSNELVGYEHDSVLRFPGEVVDDEDVSPVVVEAYEKGDKHTLGIIKKVTDAEAKKIRAKADDAEPVAEAEKEG